MIKKLLLRAAFAGTAFALLTAITTIECAIDPLAVTSVDIQKIEKAIQEALPSSKLLQAVNNKGESPVLEPIRALVPTATENEVGLAVLLMLVNAWDRIFSTNRLAIMKLLLDASVQDARQIAFKLAQDYKGHVNGLILEAQMQALSTLPKATTLHGLRAAPSFKIPEPLQIADLKAEELINLFKKYGLY